MCDGILIEVPHQGDPTAGAWADKSGIVAAMHQQSHRGDWRVFEVSTPRAVLHEVVADTETDIEEGENVEACEALRREAVALVKRHGVDASIHRGPFNVSVTGAAEGWQAGEGDEFTAALAYLGRDLSALYWVTSADEARDLYDRLTGDSAPAIGRCGPVRVAGALRRECERIGWFETQADEDDPDPLPGLVAEAKATLAEWKASA